MSKEPFPVLPDGYYVLNDDVTNLLLDRRMNTSMFGREVWRKGTRIQLYTPRQSLQTIRTWGGSVQLTTSDWNPKEEKMAKDILSKLEPAPNNLGQVLHRHGAPSEAILGVLLDNGDLSLEAIEAVADKLMNGTKDEDEADREWAALREKHWILI